jgi:hypothetical protein
MTINQIVHLKGTPGEWVILSIGVDRVTVYSNTPNPSALIVDPSDILAGAL